MTKFFNHYPLVSILIPYYNDEEFLNDSIKSVLNQTYKNFELILLDHASTDSSRQISYSFDDTRIKYINMEKNIGAGSGILLEEFLNVAKGKYVKLFCADDIMLPTGLHDLVEYMEENPEKDFAFGDMEYITPTQKKLNKTWFTYREGFNKENDEKDTLILFFNGIGHLPFPSCIVKKNAFYINEVEKIFILLYDMTLWVNLLMRDKKIGFLNKPVCLYRIHDEQMSSISDKAEKMVAFEGIMYPALFLKIKDTTFIKKVCQSCYANNLTKDDAEFIPFVIAHHYALSECPQYKIFGRITLYNILSDQVMREKIEKRFNFGIKEFREIYVNDYTILTQVSIENLNLKNVRSWNILRLLFKKLSSKIFKMK